MKISIVMATFNGEKFLGEQLASFVNQTKLPDELIVVDDDSEDQTIEILKKFQKKAPFSVKIFKNAYNIGSKEICGYGQVFSKGAKAASGDIVFFADQDDVWYKEKIASHLNAYKESSIDFVVNDALRVDENLKSLGAKESDNLDRPAWLTEFKIGCCASIRRKFLIRALPVPRFVGHDIWLTLCAVLYGSYFDIEKVLQVYRIHEKQASGSPSELQYNFARITGLFNSRRYKAALNKVKTLKQLIYLVKDLAGRADKESQLEIFQFQKYQKILVLMEKDFQQNQLILKLNGMNFFNRLQLTLKSIKEKKVYNRSCYGLTKAFADFLEPSLSYVNAKIKII
jgi:glycosyltransferase involved in cell wall biosynthesis